jgi:hypothetical protein
MNKSNKEICKCSEKGKTKRKSIPINYNNLKEKLKRSILKI